MNEFIICLLASGLCGSLILFIVKMIETKWQNAFSGNELYFGMKLALCTFLLPLLFCAFRMYLMYALVYTETKGALDFIVWIGGKDMISLRRTEILSTGIWQLNIVFFIWAAGVVIKYIFVYAKKRRNLKLVLTYLEPIKEGEAVDILQDLVKELGIKKKIKLYRSLYLVSPILVGIRKTRIILPMNEFSYEELTLILRHELEHYKQGDLIVKKLLCIIDAVYWFNPLIIRCFNDIDEYGELACDERVSQKIGKEYRRSYAALLIRLKRDEIEYYSEVAISDSAEEALKRRIQRIMKPTKGIKKRIFIAMVIALMFSCVTASYASAYAVTELYDVILNSVVPEMEEINETKQIFVHTEYEEILVPGELDNCEVFELIPRTRDANYVDITIPAGQVKVTNVISIEAGTRMGFTVSADNTTDTFTGGYAGDARHYVRSNNGSIAYIFTIEETGSYRICFENTSDHSIHLTGSVTIY